MRNASSLFLLGALLLPALAAAQSAPMARALRDDARESGRNLVAAAEAMPAAKYAYRPTAAQRSFAEILAHAAQANDYLCATLTGAKMPSRAKIAPAAGKEVLIARLRETLAFCDQTLAKLDDSKLGEELPFLNGRRTRAAVMVDAIADWESHYSQASAYLRLNGLLPPTAR